MAVPYTFGNATTSIPLSQLDTNFATAITIGNTAVYLGNTTTTFGNVTLNNVTINSGNSTVSSESISGNLTFTGTGNRILGDFSNATVASRVIFQTSTTNGNTVLNLIPNGTGTICAFGMDSDPTLTNSSTCSLNLVASTDVRLASGIRGTGTYLPVTFYTGGSERMRIDTSGNVGIGTSSPGYKLDIQSSSATLNLQSTTTTSLSYLTLRNVGYNYVGVENSAGGGLFTGSSAYALALGTVSAYPIQFGTSGTIRATIDSSGNVGIGTSSPAYKLSIQVSAGTTSFYTTDAATSDLMITPGISSGVVRVGPVSGAMALYTANTERMRIDSSGNIQVGTTSGSGTMNVFRSANGNTVGTFRSTSTSFDNDLLQLVCARAGATTQYLALSFYTNNYGTLQAYMRADGNWYNANGVYGSTSDVRLKENIIDATPKLDSLCQLKVRNFNFISDENKTKQIGFIAQEFEKVFPSMVDENKDGDKTIKTSVLIPMLVKAIQELKAELDALKGTK